MSDPLARFQKAQLIAHEISDQSKRGLQSYHAFAVMEKSDKSSRLQIKRVAGSSHAPSYNALLDICYDGVHGTGLVLVYSFMQVKIKGKNLQALISAIEKHECAYIQDYHEHFFTPPKPEEAFIEAIEVVMSMAEHH
jgi:hypothetical protein